MCTVSQVPLAGVLPADYRKLKGWQWWLFIQGRYSKYGRCSIDVDQELAPSSEVVFIKAVYSFAGFVRRI